MKLNYYGDPDIAMISNMEISIQIIRQHYA